MKLEFQVLRDGAVIFKSRVMAEEDDLAVLTMTGLQRFREQHPDFSLADEDIVLKWAEVEMLTA